MTEHPSPLLIDGRYEVEATLGRGNMGVVYRARDKGLDRTVAVKVIAQEFLGNADVIARFRREATALAAVRNEHVVQVYTFGPWDGTYFFAMEFVKGRNLDEILARYQEVEQQVPMGLAIPLLRQLASGLASVHTAGLIHRDVKPGNIVIEDGTGRAVLIDFGLARWTDGGTARNSMVAGTPSYIAPEQVLGEGGGTLSARTDQYAFACTAFEILTGHLPFEGNDAFRIIEQHLNSPRPKLSLHRPELARFDHIIERAMAIRPEDRYPTLDNFREELERAGSQWFFGDTRGLTQDPMREERKRSGTRILVISLDENFVRVASRAAQLAFFRAAVSVSSVGTAVDAIANAQRVPPQMVLIKHEPGALDAAALLAKMREKPSLKATEAIVFAAPTQHAKLKTLPSTTVLAENTVMLQLGEVIQKIGVARGWLSPEPTEGPNDDSEV